MPACYIAHSNKLKYNQVVFFFSEISQFYNYSQFNFNLGSLKRHYESKAYFLFISFTIGKDKSIHNMVSLKILDMQYDSYLARQTSKNHSEI
jgi:hypothetical protein